MSELHEQVSKTYAAALAQSPDQVPSFGCGDPLSFAAVQPGQTVVDLGSGAGLDLLAASERVGPSGRAIGVDMTAEMIAAARANAARANRSNIELRAGKIEDLPIESGTADWVISNCVINLSPDKPAVFAEIARVLAPGGGFAISDIVANDLPQWIADHPAAHAACVSGAISEDRYIEGLAAAGFVDIEVTSRLVYDEEQLRGFAADELASLELPEALVDAVLPAIVGKVVSIRVAGRKPLD